MKYTGKHRLCTTTKAQQKAAPIKKGVKIMQKSPGGRPALVVSPDAFAEQVKRYRAGEITAAAAAAALGMSRMTFFRRLKDEKQREAV